MVAFACMLVAACGGGGGGGDGSGGPPSAGPVVYAGNTAAASVTALNAAQIAADLTGGTNLVSSTGSVTGGSSSEGRGLLDIGRRLARTISPSAVRAGGASPTAAVPINLSIPCDNGGSVTVTGTLADNGTGTLSVSYSACRTTAGTVSGTASMQVDAFDLSLSILTDATISFTRLTVSGATNAAMTGSVRRQVNVSTNSETVTENVTIQFTGTGHMTKSENLVWTDVYNNILSPLTYVESVQGRLFDSAHGYVDVLTVAPFVFSSLSQEFPHSGEVTLTGAGNTRVSVAALSDMLARISVDLDGNGAYEHVARLPWTELGGPLGADLADDDGDGMHNSWETVYQLNPANGADAGSDADGDSQTNLAEYMAGTNPRTSGTPPTPPAPPGGTPGAPVALALAGNRALVYDSFTQRLYAAVGGNPGSIVPLDPVTATFGAAIPAGNDPSRLAISDDGQYFYVGLNGAASVQRIPVAAPHTPLDISLGGDGFLGPRYAEDIAVLPGAPASFAVSLRYTGVSPRHAGVAVFDGAVARPVTTPTHTGSNAIEFSAAATTLYGFNNETTGFHFFRLTVSPSGVSVLDSYDSFQPGGALISGFGTDIEFGGGLVFATTGAVVDPVARTLLGTIALPSTFGNLVVADSALNRVFYLTLNGSTWEIRAFDMTTRALLGSQAVVGVAGTPGHLVRWGTRGLAFRTSADQIFLVNSTNLIP